MQCAPFCSLGFNSELPKNSSKTCVAIYLVGIFASKSKTENAMNQEIHVGLPEPWLPNATQRKQHFLSTHDGDSSLLLYRLVLISQKEELNIAPRSMLDATLHWILSD